MHHSGEFTIRPRQLRRQAAEEEGNYNPSSSRIFISWEERRIRIKLVKFIPFSPIKKLKTVLRSFLGRSFLSSQGTVYELGTGTLNNKKVSKFHLHEQMKCASTGT